ARAEQGRDRVPTGAGSAARAARGLRRRAARLRLAAARRVQLGPRALRRDRLRPRLRAASGAVGRRGGRPGGQVQLRGHERAVEPRRELAARPGRRPGRPGDPHARQPGRAVGDDPGGDEARRRAHPVDADARAGRPARPHRPRQRPSRGGPRRGRRQVRRRAGRVHAHRGGGPHHRAVARLRRRPGRARGVHARRRHQGQRHAAAVLHQRHDGEAEARGAHAHELPRRPPVDDVLDRPAAGRRAPQRRLAGLGQARVVERLRAVDRRGDDLHLQLHQVRRRPAARRGRREGREHVLRAADGVADAHPGRPDARAGAAARGGRCRGAAEPRGHRAGPRGLGHDDPRRLRADRVDAADRQPAGPARQGRVDGPPAARLPDRARRPGERGARRRGRDLHRPGGAAARAHDRLQGRPGAQRRGHARRAVPHRRRRLPRRGRLHHLHRPLRRRVQGVGLPDQPVRAGERAHRARRGRRGRGRPVARPAAPGRAQGVRGALVAIRGQPRDGAGDPAPRPRAPARLQAGPAAGVLRAAQDDLRQDPARRAADARDRPARRPLGRLRARGRVPRRGLPRAAAV
ncbi:MAG: Acetyl-CoA synthetase, partial [uncultured Actinomycetospora sp.]